MWLRIYQLTAIMAIAYFCKLQYDGEPFWQRDDAMHVTRGGSHDTNHK